MNDHSKEPYRSPHEVDVKNLSTLFEEILSQPTATTLVEIKAQEMGEGYRYFRQITNELSIGGGKNDLGEEPTLIVDEPHKRLSVGKSIRFLLDGKYCFIYNYGKGALFIQRVGFRKPIPVSNHENHKLVEHDVISIGSLKMKIRQIGSDFFVCMKM